MPGLLPRLRDAAAAAPPATQPARIPLEHRAVSGAFLRELFEPCRWLWPVMCSGTPTWQKLRPHLYAAVLRGDLAAAARASPTLVLMLDESTDTDGKSQLIRTVPATTHRWRVCGEILENYRGGSIVCRFRTDLPCLIIVRVKRSCAQMTDGTAAELYCGAQVSPRLPLPWLSEHDGDCSIQFRPIKKNTKVVLVLTVIGNLIDRKILTRTIVNLHNLHTLRLEIAAQLTADLVPLGARALPVRALASLTLALSTVGSGARTAAPQASDFELSGISPDRHLVHLQVWPGVWKGDWGDWGRGPRLHFTCPRPPSAVADAGMQNFPALCNCHIGHRRWGLWAGELQTCGALSPNPPASYSKPRALHASKPGSGQG